MYMNIYLSRQQIPIAGAQAIISLEGPSELSAMRITQSTGNIFLSRILCHF